MSRRAFYVFLLVLVAAFALGSVVAAGQQEQQPPADAARVAALLGPPRRLDDVTRGSLLLATDQPGAYLAAPLLHTAVDLRVRGIVARAEVRQRFTNPTDRWVEGIYVFPLPDRAAVDGLEMRVGDRRIVGAIAERREARATYETARREGRRAALLEQERPNVFTSSLANLGPGETVEVVLRYQEDLRFESGSFHLRFPLVVAPRYVPGGMEGGAPAAPAARLAAAGLPDARAANPVRVRVELEAGFELARLASRSHLLRTTRGERGAWRAEVTGEVPADRDFVLEWEPVPARAPRSTLLVQPAAGGGAYALLLVLPPAGAAPPPEQRLPRETIYVLDTSGSMAGESMERAREALLFALERLAPEDRFNVVAFESTARRLFPHSAPADLESLEEARRWVLDLAADGGTEMLPALSLALAGEPERGRLRQVVFLTDGSVANERQILDFIAGGVGETRLFTVAIGSAPNSWFLRKAAELGRGSFTHVGEPREVAVRMGELYRRLESPVARDLEVAWDDPNADWWPRRLPDLYAGEPLVVAAWLPGGGGVNVGAQLDDSRYQVRLEPQRGPARGGLDKLWARRQIEALEDSLHEGGDETEVRRLVTELGLAHGLVSRWTSLVAVDHTPVAPAGSARPVALPVLLPAGWEPGPAFGPLPQTATPAPLLLLLAGSLAVVAWVVGRTR